MLAQATNTIGDVTTTNRAATIVPPVVITGGANSIVRGAIVWQRSMGSSAIPTVVALRH
jgi:hypothetical protein